MDEFPSVPEFQKDLQKLHYATSRFRKRPIILPSLQDAFLVPILRLYRFICDRPMPDYNLAYKGFLKICLEGLAAFRDALPQEVLRKPENTFLTETRSVDLSAAFHRFCEPFNAIRFRPHMLFPDYYLDFDESQPHFTTPVPRFYADEPADTDAKREWRNDRRRFQEHELAYWKESKSEFDQREIPRWKERKRKHEQKQKELRANLSDFQTIFIGTPFCHYWTDFSQYYQYECPLELTRESRMRHQWVISPTGGGKTTLLESQIINDIDAVERGECAVVVIDSQALPGKPSLINNLSRLKVFAPGQPLYDKFVLLEPDPEYPLALNLFDVGETRPTAERERQQFNTEAGNLIQFSIAAMSDQQADLFSYVVQLLLTIPDATVDDLVEVLGDSGLRAERYQDALGRADSTVQKFFRTYDSPGEFGNKATRDAVLRRVLGMLREETFRRMFLAKKNKFNMQLEIAESKVILINTDKALLGKRACEGFGRFFIAQLLHVMQSRTSDLPVYVYIDEMHDYLSNDEALEDLNDQARKRNMAMIYSHQRISNIHSPGILSSLRSLAVQFAGGNRDDAAALANLLQATEEDIRSVPVGTFMLYVDKITTKAIRVQVRELFSEREKMTDDELRRVKQRMRDKYCYRYVKDAPKAAPKAASKQPPKQKQKPAAPPPSSSDPDDDSDATPFI